MSFHYSTYIYNTKYRRTNHCSYFNEDAHCDNEVNLILEKKYNQSLIEQSTKKSTQKKQQSADINQIDQYYFTPIQEQNCTTTILNENNVIDNSSLLLITTNLQYPSTLNLFDDCSQNNLSSSILNMNSSDTPTISMNQSNHYNLTDADLADLLVSSIIPTTSNDSIDNVNNNNNNNNNTLDDVFLNQVNDLVCSSSLMIDKQQTIGPPPGFENFLFDSSSTSNLLLNSTTNKINSPRSSIINATIQTPVSSSDTINFSQLLQSTIVDPQQQQQTIAGNIRSSSHSSFTSDEQSMFFPIYSPSSSSSSYAKSQIFSTNTPSSSTTTITTTQNSVAKSHIPSSLSLNNNNHYSSSASLIPNSTTDSPIENEKRIIDGSISSNYPSSNFSTNQFFSTTARTSSSNSSSSSIDDALIQLSQQQQQQHLGNINKLFNDEPMSIFHLSSLPSKTNIDKQQEQAVHDNINFLASMAIASTPVTPIDSNINLQHQKRTTTLQHQMSSPQISSRTKSINTQELMQNLNELCYKGFDELNALIQEQRWVQSYVNMNSSLIPSPTSPSMNSNCCSSRILIVCEYFIFKCKKVEITASHVFELLANGKAELRLRDLMFVFKSWKEAILNAEIIHQEEENKLRLSTEHPQSYYMTENVLQAAFDRVSYSIRQLCHITQQARAAFQYATLNVFQTSSRQPIQSQSSTVLAQLQAMQQPKSSFIHNQSNGSIRTTP